jgi:hypothetical protein
MLRQAQGKAGRAGGRRERACCCRSRALPDMTGWPVREAVRHFRCIHPKVQGTGVLARQEPSPGIVVDKGGTVVLIFEPAT